MGERDFAERTSASNEKRNVVYRLMTGVKTRGG
jgi:hypothetical protein